MTSTLLFMAVLSLINGIRGSGVFKSIFGKRLEKPAFALTSATSGSLFFIAQHGFDYGAWILGAFMFVGLWLWIAPGWGRYFTVITGNSVVLQEQEIAWIDAIANKISMNPYSNGLIGMSLRGLYLYPLFILLSFFNPLSLFIGLLCLLQGVFYGIAGLISKDNAVRLAELTWFAFVAFIITLSI